MPATTSNAKPATGRWGHQPVTLVDPAGAVGAVVQVNERRAFALRDFGDGATVKAALLHHRYRPGSGQRGQGARIGVIGYQCREQANTQQDEEA